MSDHIRVGIVTQAFFFGPFWAADELGLYGKRDITVDILDLGGIDAVTAALKAGEIEIGVGSPEHVIHDVEAGGSLRMIGGNVNRPTHYIIAQPEIKTLQELRGKTIGVSALSGGTSSLFMEVLDKVGLGAGDYNVIESGAVPPRHLRLKERKIDAAMQTDPHNYIAEDEGFSNLGSVMDWIPYFQFDSINARLDWCQANTDVLVRFLAATIEASQWMHDDRPGCVALTSGRMSIDPKYAERAWDDHMSNGALPLDLHLDARSIDAAIEMMRRDRSGSVKVDVDAPAEKYVALDYLRAAQALVDAPERLLAGR